MSPKHALRQRTSDKRNALRPEDREDRAALIGERLFAQPEYERSSYILFYAAFGSEVPTLAMMETSLKAGKKIALPITDTENNSLVPRGVDDLSTLFVSKYGIPEPVVACTCDCATAEIDLVIVPGMVFDECGNRIGYGGGYYDRFLSRVGAAIPRLSIAYELQIVPHIPRESHDLPVDKIITERRVIVAEESRRLRGESIRGY
ncbi:MAG: 5-formyltetrahydrofolate cyclo-ligase [Actinobacteria bacterium]|nr:5-formyltetrahydrofolate cyclo-ligase [Actinomycetota bacterium]